MSREADQNAGARMRTAIAGVLLFLSLLAMRREFLAALDLSVGTAWSLGLPRGMLTDALLAVGATAIAILARVATPRIPPWSPWAATTALLWLVSFAGVSYFQFFHAPLEWWVVRHHWSDLAFVFRSRDFAHPTIGSVVSLALAVGACLVSRGLPPVARAPSKVSRAAAVALPILLLMLVAGGYVERRVRMLYRSDAGTVINDHVLARWADAWTAEWPRLPRLPLRPPRARDGADPGSAFTVLAQYRDLRGVPSRPGDPTPLARELPRAGGATERSRVGLPAEGPIHVVILVVESLRTWEWEHPELAPLVFPKLGARTARHGMSFRQTYAGSFEAGESVRGRFSTLCSMLDVEGPASYVANPYLRVRCLADVFRANGHRTMAFSAFPRSFHNAGLFETLHGTEEFLDIEQLTDRGATTRVGGWDLLTDAEVLPIVLSAFLDATGKVRPVFATIATSGTHFPWRLDDGETLPPPLAEIAAKSREPDAYAGYLAKLRLADAAIDDFLEGLFSGPAADRTLVVMLGDHAIGLPPGQPLDEIQDHELRFRVPLVLFTRDMPPSASDAVIAHQYDVAPTVASLAGLSGVTTWVGRDLLTGSGSPWISVRSWRNGETACYGRASSPEPACFTIATGGDPLFSPGARTSRPSDPVSDAFFRSVASGAADVLTANALPVPTD